MIVWINGAFGSGKTTLVTELSRRRADALVFDPELVGFVVRQIVPVPTGDFQDLRLWRRQTACLAIGLVEEYRRPVLVPMTLVDEQYLAEVFGELRSAGVIVHHFFLRVPAETLIRRIDAQVMVPDDSDHDGRVRRWRKDQIDRCVTAPLPDGTVVLDGEAPPETLADQVLRRLEVSEVR